MEAERFWVVKASLAITSGCFAFFVVAPAAVAFPLSYDQVIRLLQIIVPVFVGYLGIATVHVFSTPSLAPDATVRDGGLLRLLTRWPVRLFALGLCLVIGVFWYTNRPSGPAGTGMTLDQLSWFISVLLGVQAATTGVVVARVFPGEPK